MATATIVGEKRRMNHPDFAQLGAATAGPLLLIMARPFDVLEKYLSRIYYVRQL